MLELFFIGGNLTELCLCIRNYYQFLILFDDNSSSTNLTSPAPETTSQVPEYAEEDYNNYTEASDNVYEIEEPTASEQQPLEEAETQQNYLQAYQPLPVDPRHKRKSQQPVNTGIYSAFQRVTNVFDNLFVNR